MAAHFPTMMGKVGLVWLEGLPADSIDNWAQMCCITNFQATYTRPGNRWDLSHVRQRQDETLHQYTDQCFVNRNQLYGIEDCDFIDNYLNGITNKPIWKSNFQTRPATIKERMDTIHCEAKTEEAEQEEVLAR